MKWMRIVAIVVAVAAVALGGAGCEKSTEEGPAESAGKSLDEGIERAGEALKGAAEEAEGAAKETAEDVKEKVEN